MHPITKPVALALSWFGAGVPGVIAAPWSQRASQRTTAAISHKQNGSGRLGLSDNTMAASKAVNLDSKRPIMPSEYSPIRIVSPAAFDPGTAQTPGSVRLAAVAPQLGIQSTLWGGLFEVKPGARTGIHHHGKQQTIAYVLSGMCEVRWGARGECAARAQAGDFIHVPAFLPHMEINPSDSEPFHWVVVRSTSAPIVVNLPDDTWP
jgi:uncharacterized RmlC-like cupin family protein